MTKQTPSLSYEMRFAKALAGVRRLTDLRDYPPNDMEYANTLATMCHFKAFPDHPKLGNVANDFDWLIEHIIDKHTTMPRRAEIRNIYTEYFAPADGREPQIIG